MCGHDSLCWSRLLHVWQRTYANELNNDIKTIGAIDNNTCKYPCAFFALKRNGTTVKIKIKVKNKMEFNHDDGESDRRPSVPNLRNSFQLFVSIIMFHSICLPRHCPCTWIEFFFLRVDWPKWWSHYKTHVLDASDLGSKRKLLLWFGWIEVQGECPERQVEWKKKMPRHS